MFNHIVAESVRKHLPGKGWNRHSGALALQDIPKILKVAVSSTHSAVLELEGGDVRSADNLVVRIHAAGCAVGLGILNLLGGE